MIEIETHIVALSNWIWGLPLLFLLLGGGLYFLVYSRFLPYRYFFYGIKLLYLRHGMPQGPGQLSAYQALATALASTVGMGNIAGVAVAIHLGGPGAVFWMWISALVGMATNFFSCTLASMYRGRDSRGEIQGGPMYVIREGLNKRWRPLAVFFSVCCLFGALPIFQANQLTRAIDEIILTPMGIAIKNYTVVGTTVNSAYLFIGIALTVFVGIVVIGGIKRIGQWAGRMVPVMIVIYFISVVVILLTNLKEVPYYLWLIITNAFTAENYHGAPDPITGGVVGGLIILGARRASFSNEAGIGTAPMALGTSKSNEPVREGLIAMLTPAIDTIIVCTCTALAILVTGVWKTSSSNGIALTMDAFNAAMPGTGRYVLMVCILFFSITSLFSYCYYGIKSTSFLLGADKGHWYNYFYLPGIIIGSISSLSAIISVIDIAFALMAIPTMFSTLVLSPKVMDETRKYFRLTKTSN